MKICSSCFQEREAFIEMLPNEKIRLIGKHGRILKHLCKEILNYQIRCLYRSTGIVVMNVEIVLDNGFIVPVTA
jgi:hypothetical protein